MAWWEWIAAFWWAPIMLVYAFNPWGVVHGDEDGEHSTPPDP